MNITKRIEKLEHKEIANFALILFLDGDTQEEAYQRYSTENNKPHVVVFVSPLDMLL